MYFQLTVTFEGLEIKEVWWDRLQRDSPTNYILNITFLLCSNKISFYHSVVLSLFINSYDFLLINLEILPRKPVFLPRTQALNQT